MKACNNRDSECLRAPAVTLLLTGVTPQVEYINALGRLQDVHNVVATDKNGKVNELSELKRRPDEHASFYLSRQDNSWAPGSATGSSCVHQLVFFVLSAFFFGLFS